MLYCHRFILHPFRVQAPFQGAGGDTVEIRFGEGKRLFPEDVKRRVGLNFFPLELRFIKLRIQPIEREQFRVRAALNNLPPVHHKN
jgi:hypothetical protein